MGRTTLAMTGVHAGYQQGIDVLRGVDFSTEAFPITAVIGPNGAGKSTMLRTIFGFLSPTAGSIRLGSEDIGALSPYVLKKKGLSYIAQGLSVFPQLTVEETLRIGAWTIRSDRARVRRQLEFVYSLFPMLRDLRSRRATKLSGGQAKMLSIAKDVMTDPVVLLVDEPTAGLSPALNDQVYAFLLQTQKALGCSIVLVDQNIDGAVAIADYVYLMDLGRVRNHGPSSEFGPERVSALIRECLTG